MDINEYIIKKLEFERFNDDPSNDVFWDGITGVAKSTSLTKILLMGKKHKSISCLLPKIFEHCSKDSVDDEVFNMVRKYPSRGVRNSLFISMAHCPLSFYQYKYINSLGICGEAFAALLDMYICNDCFSVFDLEKLLKENSRFVACIDFSGILADYDISAGKRSVLSCYERYGK